MCHGIVRSTDPLPDSLVAKPPEQKAQTQTLSHESCQAHKLMHEAQEKKAASLGFGSRGLQVVLVCGDLRGRDCSGYFKGLGNLTRSASKPTTKDECLLLAASRSEY